MVATINFGAGGREEVVLVAAEAVIQTGTRTVVIVAEDEGRFVPVDVEIGIESGGETEIRKGLEAGQKVVVSSQFLIDSEASLKATVTRMSDAPAPSTETSARATHRGAGRVERIRKDEVTL